MYSIFNDSQMFTESAYSKRRAAETFNNNYINLNEKNSHLAGKKEKLIEVLEKEISQAKFLHKDNALIHRELIEQNVSY